MRRYHSRRTVLKTTAGAAAVATGLATFANPAAAHFPEELEIDVKPGTDENPINPRSEGVTTVAVLQNDAFDPTSEAVRYRFGSPGTVADGSGATPVRYRVRDVDGDGRNDLVLQFRTADTGFDRGDEVAELRWDRDESREHGLSGTDEIRTVGGGRR
jgi:hypothetical protein